MVVRFAFLGLSSLNNHETPGSGFKQGFDFSSHDAALSMYYSIFDELNLNRFENNVCVSS